MRNYLIPGKRERSKIMAFISYVEKGAIPERDRVDDDDNIIQVHGHNSRVMKHHFDLYVTLMRRSGPLSRRLREMVAVTVSAINSCRY